MKKNILVYSIIMFFFIQNANAQSEFENKGKTHIGLGLGLSYGAFGGRIVTNPSENLGLFLGLGYQIVAVGYNLGVMYYIPSETRTQAYLSAMYGTNAAIKIEGLSEFDKSYTGATFGFGFMLNSRANPGSYWDFGILLPLRSSSYNDDWDNIKSNPSIVIEADPWPILINIGYNFNLN